MAEVRLTYTVESVTPLLMHNPASMAPKPGGGKTAVKKVLTPEEEAERAAYRSPDGFLVFPTQAFRSSLLLAAEKWPIPGKARGNISSYMAHIQVEPDEFVSLVDGDGELIRDYVIDGRRGVNPSTGGGIWISRPKIEYWRATFSFIVDTDLIGEPETMVTQILADAGKRVGVGAFRPLPPKTSKGKGGWFGRYRIIGVSES